MLYEYSSGEGPFGQKTRTTGSPAPKRGKHSGSFGAAPYNFQTAHDAVAGGRTGQGAVMDWARILAYVTGTVDQEPPPAEAGIAPALTPLA